MNPIRSKNTTAKRAIFGALLATIVLSGCSNPYSVPEVDPGLKAPSANEPLAPAPELHPLETEKEIEHEPGTVTDYTDQDPRTAQEQYFSIDPAVIELPQTYVDNFGESSKTIARDALFAISINSVYRDYQSTPLTEDDHPLLFASMQDLLSTNGQEAFKAAIEKSYADPAQHANAFSILPYATEQRFTTIDGVDYNIDAGRMWDVKVWNTKFEPILEDGVSDAAVFVFDRSVYIPVQDGKTLRVDSQIKYGLILDGNGNWVIDSWSYNHAMPELEN